MVQFSTPEYKVIEILKKSKARYANGIKVGDTVKFEMGQLGGRRGDKLYSTDITMFVNEECLTTVTQGEFPKVLQIFELEEN